MLLVLPRFAMIILAALVVRHVLEQNTSRSSPGLSLQDLLGPLTCCRLQVVRTHRRRRLRRLLGPLWRRQLAIRLRRAPRRGLPPLRQLRLRFRPRPRPRPQPPRRNLLCVSTLASATASSQPRPRLDLSCILHQRQQGEKKGRFAPTKQTRTCLDVEERRQWFALWCQRIVREH